MTAPPSNGDTDLFGFPVSAPASNKTPEKGGRSGRVAAATPSANAARIADALPPQVYLGTSSWSFPGWAGLVYDGVYTESKLARDGLGAYAQHPLLRTVSIDRTFYAPLSEKDFADYAAQVPEHFRFVTKAPMAITSSYLRDDDGKFSDSPFYLDAEYAVNEFIAPCTNGLLTKSGPLVFQFPPQGKRHTSNPDPFINRLYRFLNVLPPGIHYAVEVRDPELLTDRFFKCLSATNAMFCIASHARMPSPAEQIAMMRTHHNDTALVCRWSLHAGFRYEDAKSRYYPFDKIVDEDIPSREAIASAIVAAASAGKPSFVTINNKAEGSAPLSVERLAELVVAYRTGPPNPKNDKTQGP